MDLPTLIDAYRGPLVGLFASWGAPWNEAVELAEETFAQAWLSRDACSGDANDLAAMGRWLRGVARNQFRNWSRARRRRQTRLTLFPGDSLDQHAARDDSPARDYLDTLRAAIERLPQPQREVVLMHYLEETSIRDVATLLGVTVKTVEGRLYQARLSLRRMLDDKVRSNPLLKTIMLCLWI